MQPLILADPACKVTTSWCMKLFPETKAMTDGQIYFNKSLSGARVVVEQAFGLFKLREVELSTGYTGRISAKSALNYYSLLCSAQ